MMPQKLKEKKLVHYSLDGELEMFAKYLSEGVDPNCIDNDGWTSLLAASYRGHYKIVKLALEKGANVNARDKEGWNALHWAARYGHTDICQLLLDSGIDALAKTKYNESTIDKAKQGRHMKLVKILEVAIKKQKLVTVVEEENQPVPSNQNVSVGQAKNVSRTGSIASSLKAIRSLANMTRASSINSPATPSKVSSHQTDSAISKSSDENNSAAYLRSLNSMAPVKSTTSILSDSAHEKYLNSLKQENPSAYDFWIQNFLAATAVPTSRFILALELYNNTHNGIDLPAVPAGLKSSDFIDPQLFRMLVNSGPLSQVFTKQHEIITPGALQDELSKVDTRQVIRDCITKDKEFKSILKELILKLMDGKNTLISDMQIANHEMLGALKQRNAKAYTFWVENFLTSEAVPREQFNYAIQLANSTRKLNLPVVDVVAVDLRMFNILCNGPLKELFCE